MSIKMTPAIEAAGYGISGSIGGLPRTTYYTPDGRTIKAIPNMRERVRKDKDGNVIWHGTVDANLDKGWLLQMPEVKKPYCKFCDRWHDTTVEVEACGVTQAKMIERLAKKTQEEVTDRTTELEQKVADLEAMVKKLLEVQNR